VTDRPPLYRLIWLFLCTGLTVVILWLALMPAVSAPSGLGWDKLNHAGAMAVATGLAFLSLQSRRWAAAAAFLYGTSLGILIEILQATLTTSRVAECGDVVADVIGAGSAWILIQLYLRRTTLERQP
jgi:VanZ family protein